jgi:hypothetical protein
VRPWKNTTARGSVETYRNTYNHANITLPRDVYSEWRDAGMPVWNPTFGWRLLGGTTYTPVAAANEANPPTAATNPEFPLGLYPNFNTFFARPNAYVDHGIIERYEMARGSTTNAPGFNSNYRYAETGGILRRGGAPGPGQRKSIKTNADHLTYGSFSLSLNHPGVTPYTPLATSIASSVPPTHLKGSMTAKMYSFLTYVRTFRLLGLMAMTSLPATLIGQTCCDDGCSFDLTSNMYVLNNQWGKNSSPSGYWQCITRNSSTAFKVDFNWPAWPSGDSRNNSVKCYPAAILGWHWGWAKSGTNLPQRLDANYSATSSYAYTANFGSGGVGNVAYDLWLTTTSNPTNTTQPTDEIMIWVNSTGGAGPCGSVTRSGISLEGATWDLYECQIPNYQYVWSFVRRGNSGSGTLNIKAFIDWLRANRGLSSTKYLAGIQFGTEVFRGAGTVDVTHYTCTVGTGGGGGSFVKLRNRATGLMIDGMGRTANGSNCGQYASGGSYNQQWAAEAVGSYYRFRNRGTGLYMDGMGRTDNGSTMGQWSSSSSNNQQFAREATGSYYKYRNRATGLYVDGMGRTGNGSDLGQWSSSTSYNQQWQETAP